MAVQWKFAGKEIAFTDLNFTIDHNQLTLSIKSLTEQNAGEYSCIVVSPEGRILNGSNFFVGVFTQPAHPVSVRDDAVPGMSRTLVCPATAIITNKTHIIQWYRVDKRGNMEAITQSTKGLRIVDKALVFDTVLNDNGVVYHCVATSTIAQESYYIAVVLGNMVPSFSSKTLMELPSASRYDVLETLNINASFKYISDGLIVFNADQTKKDIFALGMRAGKVELQLNLGSDTTTTLSSTNAIASPSWVNVAIRRFRRNVTMFVNNVQQGSSQLIGDTGFSALELGNTMFFGAHPAGLQSTNFPSSFAGAISYFAINGRVLRFGQEYISKRNEGHFNVCSTEQISCTKSRYLCNR